MDNNTTDWAFNTIFLFKLRKLSQEVECNERIINLDRLTCLLKRTEEMAETNEILVSGYLHLYLF